MKIVHIITSLRGAGAQYIFFRLLERLSPDYKSEVISLYNFGVVGELIADLGIPVTTLDNTFDFTRMLPGQSSRAGGGYMPAVLDVPRVLRLASMLRKAKPDIVHTWMHHANFLGGLAARLAGVKRVIWGLQGELDPRYTNLITRVMGWELAVLSHYVPQSIVSCAYVTRDHHIQMGYEAEKFTVIPNGCDTVKFRPDPEIKRRIRREIGFDDGRPVVGMLARFHEQKRQQDFVKLVQILRKSRPDAGFVMSGRGIDTGNTKLMGWIKDAGVDDIVKLLGERNDMPQLLNGLDVFVSPSISEGFPLAIGEAMATEVPCVATDVGDTGYLIGEDGVCTTPGNVAELTAGVERLLALSPEERQKLGWRARERVVNHFNLDTVTRQFENVYDRVRAETHFPRGTGAISTSSL